MPNANSTPISAYCGKHTTHVKRRDDAVIHSGRDFVPTIYGQESGNTVFVANLEQLHSCGGQITFNEDQTEIWLTLPEGHKFSIQMFNREENKVPPAMITAITELQSEKSRLETEMHLARKYSQAQHDQALMFKQQRDELLAALEWCEQVYGEDWPANASIRETIAKAKGV